MVRTSLESADQVRILGHPVCCWELKDGVNEAPVIDVEDRPPSKKPIAPFSVASTAYSPTFSSGSFILASQVTSSVATSGAPIFTSGLRPPLPSSPLLAWRLYLLLCSHLIKWTCTSMFLSSARLSYRSRLGPPQLHPRLRVLRVAISLLAVPALRPQVCLATPPPLVSTSPSLQPLGPHLWQDPYPHPPCWCLPLVRVSGRAALPRASWAELEAILSRFCDFYSKLSSSASCSCWWSSPTQGRTSFVRPL